MATLTDIAIWGFGALFGVGVGFLFAAFLFFREPITDPSEVEFPEPKPEPHPSGHHARMLHEANGGTT